MSTSFKPMLAVNANLNTVRLPLIGSNKLEGVRGVFTPFGLRARSLKCFGNPTLELEFCELSNYCIHNNVTIEGEFYLHGMEYNEISSICRRSNHEDTGKISFWIFDFYDNTAPYHTFMERIEEISNTIDAIEFYKNNIHIVRQKIHSSLDEITQHYSEAIEDGYEGIVLKDPLGTYKCGRSTKKDQVFLRMKPEDTYDGVVIEIVERLENLAESKENELGYLSKRQDKDLKANTGLAAVAIVEVEGFESPIRVTLSRGIKDYEDTKKSPSRASIWKDRDTYVGRHLKFVGMPVKGMAPRSPRFDDWRADLDS